MKRTRRGMTLVELIAAVAISAILAVAALTIVRGVARPVRDAANDDSGDALYRIIKRDLECSVELRAFRDRLEFRGYSMLRGRPRDPSHGPVLVAYNVKRAGGREWLVRGQRVLTSGEEETDIVGRAPSVPGLWEHRGSSSGRLGSDERRFLASSWVPTPSGLRVASATDPVAEVPDAD